MNRRLPQITAPVPFAPRVVAAWTAAIVALSALLPGCVIIVDGDARASATVQRTATVADARMVLVEGENGSIRFEQDATVSGVAIEATIRCSGSDQAEADARAADATLVADRDADGQVSIRADFPGGAGTWSSDSASFVIRAASLDHISAATSNGRIAVRNFRASIDARSRNGAIDISGAGASVRARTSNGRIEVTLADGAEGGVDLSTSNGAVKLVLPASWQGAVRATTSNGRIELPGATSRGGSSEAVLGDAAKSTATITTSNGGITVRQNGK